MSSDTSRKRRSVEEIVARLQQVDALTAQSRPVAEAVRQTGVADVICGMSC